MTPENEALIADLERLTNAGFGICRSQAIDLIAALRAADERERELVEALTQARQGLHWYRRKCAHLVDGSDDEMDKIIDRALRGKS